MALRTISGRVPPSHPRNGRHLAPSNSTDIERCAFHTTVGHGNAMELVPTGRRPSNSSQCTSTDVTALGIEAENETVDWQDAKHIVCCITSPESGGSRGLLATAESKVKVMLSRSQGFVNAGLLALNCDPTFAQAVVRIDGLLRLLVLRVREINGSPRRSVLRLSARVPVFATLAKIDNNKV